MRIFFILEYYSPHIGGVETLFKSLVHKLDQQGHQITILTNRYDKNLPKQEVVGNNTTIVRKRLYNRYLFTFLAWWPALKYARKAEIIHTTSYNAAVPAWITAKLTGAKSIITFHERWGRVWFRLPWMSSFSKFVHYSFEWAITKLNFNKFVAVSNFTHRSLIEAGVASKRVVTIYNGIEYNDFPKHEPIVESKFTFLYFGRAGIGKGLDILIDAYSSLIEIRQDHQLLLILPSEENAIIKNIKNILRSPKFSNFVTIKNDLSYNELKIQISKSGAVVIPSYSEGFCFAAVESMAIGTPIISSGQGALTEVIGGTYITTSNHSVAALALSMSNAIEGKWSIKEVKKFDLSDTVNAYIELYRELIIDK